MKALVIDKHVPTPDRDFGSVRTVSMLRLLHDLSCEIDFIADETTIDPIYIQQLKDIGIGTSQLESAQSPKTYLQDHGKEYDFVIVIRVRIATKYLPFVKTHAPQACIVFDTVDLHFVREFRAAKLSHNAARLKNALLIKGQEIEAVRTADHVVVISTTEKEALEKECEGADIHVITQAHEVHQCIASFENRSGLLFVGHFQHLPNIDAMQYYSEKLHPLLAERLPGIKTYIVGGNPPAEVQALVSDTVIVTGHVPDLGEYFEKCRLSIAPLRFGAGIKGKVLDSMSYGVPVVASSIAAEGLPVRVGSDLLVSDNPQAFCNAVADVHQDIDLWTRLSDNSREVIRREFSEDSIRRQLSNLLVSIGK